MGFIYNGISSQSMKIRARLTKWQVSPALRNSFETVPGKAGIADFGCDISERNIIISCSVLPQRSFTELVSVLDNVAEWLNPENGLKQLVIDDLPDRYFMARLSEAVATLYVNNRDNLGKAEQLIRSAILVAEQPTQKNEMILGVVE
jgi:predicted phage tail component-like protein